MMGVMFLLTQVYNTRIRANSEVVRPISKCQAEIRKQLTDSLGKVSSFSVYKAV